MNNKEIEDFTYFVNNCVCVKDKNDGSLHKLKLNKFQINYFKKLEMLKTFNKLIDKFAEEGWKHKHLFMRGSKFVKDDYSIQLTKNNVRLWNNVSINYDTLYAREELRYQLKDICSKELIDLFMKYIEENIK